RLIPEPVELVTIDLSYLSLSNAVPQLALVRLAPDAEAVALVKPQFELQLPAPPRDHERLVEAVERASLAFTVSGWVVLETIQSPLPGRHGAIEFLLHATRS